MPTLNNTSEYFLKPEESVNARPHPGPLPRGEGEAFARSGTSYADGFISSRRTFETRPTGNLAHECNRQRTISPPLLGERAGVRASNLSAPFASSRINSHPLASIF